MGRHERAFAVTFVCTIIGGLFAVLLQYWYDNGVLAAADFNAETLKNFQVLIVSLFMIVGAWKASG